MLRPSKIESAFGFQRERLTKHTMRSSLRFGSGGGRIAEVISGGLRFAIWSDEGGEALQRGNAFGVLEDAEMLTSRGFVD